MLIKLFHCIFSHYLFLLLLIFCLVPNWYIMNIMPRVGVSIWPSLFKPKPRKKIQAWALGLPIWALTFWFRPDSWACFGLDHATLKNWKSTLVILKIYKNTLEVTELKITNSNNHKILLYLIFFEVHQETKIKNNSFKRQINL